MAQQIINTGTLPNDGTGDDIRAGGIKINSNFTELYQFKSEKIVRVKQASDFGVIDSTKIYVIDGIIDMGSTSIEVPSGGINIIGYTFDVSKLISSDASYTMFTSPVGGSGNVLAVDIAMEVTGASSKVFDLVSATGFEAFEFNRVNWNNCTSLGVIDNYRQGLESGTGRFGGTPELELKGVWIGGYFIDTSIVRSLTDGTYSLYKAGLGFTMSSRFRSNQNIDLPANASFIDFAPSNFLNPSTLQLTEMIISRNGVIDASDTNLTPNIDKSDLECSWKNNNGLPNTFEGGSIGVATEAATVIVLPSTFVTLNAGSWNTNDLEHFDNPLGNQLRHLGNSPREYKVIADLTLESQSNNVLTVRVRKWDNSAATFITVLDQNRQVNSLVGGRDVAFFNININTELDQNDYIELQVANQTSITNVTAEVDSYYIIEER